MSSDAWISALSAVGVLIFVIADIIEIRLTRKRVGQLLDIVEMHGKILEILVDRHVKDWGPNTIPAVPPYSLKKPR